jgi:hypothetical protein
MQHKTVSVTHAKVKSLTRRVDRFLCSLDLFDDLSSVVEEKDKQYVCILIKQGDHCNSQIVKVSHINLINILVSSNIVCSFEV